MKRPSRSWLLRILARMEVNHNSIGTAHNSARVKKFNDIHVRHGCRPSSERMPDISAPFALQLVWTIWVLMYTGKVGVGSLGSDVH